LKGIIKVMSRNPMKKEMAERSFIKMPLSKLIETCVSGGIGMHII
jgi:hypothetical protein